MSMSPLHGAVLGAAAVVASPALWLSLVEGTLGLGDALTRYLVSVAVCWAALNVVAQLAFPGPAPTPVPADDTLVLDAAADHAAGQPDRAPGAAALH